MFTGLLSLFWMYLPPLGDVVSEETYNKCIKPEGEFKGKRVGPKDIIRLQGGGTGYAGRDGEKAQVKKHFALGESPSGIGWALCTTAFDTLRRCSGHPSDVAAGYNEPWALLLNPS